MAVDSVSVDRKRKRSRLQRGTSRRREGFRHDRFEMRIGLTKFFALAYPVAPSLMEKLVRPGQ